MCRSAGDARRFGSWVFDVQMMLPQGTCTHSDNRGTAPAPMGMAAGPHGQPCQWVAPVEVPMGGMMCGCMGCVNGFPTRPVGSLNLLE